MPNRTKQKLDKSKPLNPRIMMLYILVHGDLLTAMDVDCIVQQSCCTAMRAHGLAAAIAARWPHCDPYVGRTRHIRNWATSDSRPFPGTIQLMPTRAMAGPKFVVCAFAQYCHGKSGKYQDPLGMDIHPMIGYGDSSDARFKWFRECLDELALKLAAMDPPLKSVGFPFRIGCGLAGGSWPRYEHELRRWSDAHPELDVCVYQLELE